MAGGLHVDDDVGALEICEDDAFLQMLYGNAAPPEFIACADAHSHRALEPNEKRRTLAAETAERAVAEQTSDPVPSGAPRDARGQLEGIGRDDGDFGWHLFDADAGAVPCAWDRDSSGGKSFLAEPAALRARNPWDLGRGARSAQSPVKGTSVSSGQIIPPEAVGSVELLPRKVRKLAPVAAPTSQGLREFRSPSGAGGGQPAFVVEPGEEDRGPAHRELHTRGLAGPRDYHARNRLSGGPGLAQDNHAQTALMEPDTDPLAVPTPARAPFPGPLGALKPRDPAHSSSKSAGTTSGSHFDRPGSAASSLWLTWGTEMEGPAPSDDDDEGSVDGDLVLPPTQGAGDMGEADGEEDMDNPDPDFGKGPFVAGMKLAKSIIEGHEGAVEEHEARTMTVRAIKREKSSVVVPLIVGVVESVSQSSWRGDCRILFKDMSGSIEGSVHWKMFQSGVATVSVGHVGATAAGKRQPLMVGAALVLKNVLALRALPGHHILNITAANVSRIFPPDTPGDSEDGQVPGTFLPCMKTDALPQGLDEVQCTGNASAMAGTSIAKAGWDNDALQQLLGEEEDLEMMLAGSQ